MNKNTHKQMEEDICTQLEDIFNEIEEIRRNINDTTFCYIDEKGEKYYEYCGLYNDFVSKAIVSDMFQYQLMFNGIYSNLARMIKNWSIQMIELNNQLTDMMDNEVNNLPIRSWNYKKTYEFIEEIKKVMTITTELYEIVPDEILKCFLEKCKNWTTRIIYMNTWAFSIKNMRYCKEMLFESQIHNNLDKNSQRFMKLLCVIHMELTSILLKIPVNSDDYQYVINILERFKLISYVIMENIK